MQKIVLSDDVINDIRDTYYETDMSLEEVAAKFGLSSSKIRNTLLSCGCVMKPQRHRKYTVNENYFDIIDTPNKAYIIGLLAADGSNNEKEGEIRLSLQERDVDILYKINECIGSNRPLAVRKFQKETWQDSYTLVINSHHMSDRLSEIGIVQKKSLILDFPKDIPRNLIPNMLRGYIDGDGWIQPHLIGFMSTDKFCYQAQKYLMDYLDIDSVVMNMKRSYNIHTKTLYITGIKNLIPFAYSLYEDSELCLERKKTHCIEYGFLLEPDNSLLA